MSADDGADTGPAGFLLVAAPALLDPNFSRAVVLIVSHDDQGAFGLVLNRPLDKKLSDLLDVDDEVSRDVAVHLGGPVGTDKLQFIGGVEGCGHSLVPGVVVGAGLDELCGAGHLLRAFVGYAGWGAGQLERETEEGSWIVAPAAARHVFDVPADELWATVLRELGGEYAWMALEDGPGSEN